MMLYKTSSTTPEIRDRIPNGTNHFDVCEDCQNENYENYMDVRYYSRYRRALCDACVDARDGWRWPNKKDFSHKQVMYNGVSTA